MYMNLLQDTAICINMNKYTGKYRDTQRERKYMLYANI